jgi:hypothetical protein
MQKPKSLLFSTVFRFVLLLTSSILLLLVLDQYNVPKWATVLLIFTLFMIISAVWPFYIIYKSKSLRSIERYVIRNYKKPIFGYSYALGHGTKQDVEDALKRIINSYGQGDMQGVYGAQLALVQNNSKKVLEQTTKIEGQEYKEYYTGLAYVMNRNYTRAEESLASLHTPWMQHSLRAYAALKRQQMEEFERQSELSITSAEGMQRLVLHHMMRRFREGDF